MKKYGAVPNSDGIDGDMFWQNDLYQDDYQDWGMAVSCGHMSAFATWETPETDINLGLFGDNYEISLGVEYSSKELRSLTEQVSEQKHLDDL